MTTPSPSDPVALELALALRATREALDERDAELEASRAKRAELVTELEATKTTLEATNTTLEALQALHPTKIDGNVACAIFSHLKEPKDRDALASVSTVFRDAEKSDASLPGGLSALEELGDEFHNETKFAEAVYWYRKGDDRGDAGCMHMIGLCYRYGNGVEKDMRKAFEWLEKASELGHVGATHDLAGHYELGVGVDVDEAKAIELYVKAAGMGHPASARHLGDCYYHEECGVAEDINEALKWYRRACELGDSGYSESRADLIEEGLDPSESDDDDDDDEQSESEHLATLPQGGHYF